MNNKILTTQYYVISFLASIFIFWTTISANYDIRVQRCFAFDETDTWWWLVDERGCKDDKLISEFTYDKSTGSAEATIYSMFRLPHSNRTFFQCDVAICKGECKKHDCKKEKLTLEDEGKLKWNKIIMVWTLL